MGGTPLAAREGGGHDKLSPQKFGDKFGPGFTKLAVDNGSSLPYPARSKHVITALQAMRISRGTFLTLLVSVSLLLSLPALARDSSNVVYVGQINLGSDAERPDTKGVEPLAMIYHDERGPGGDDRKVTVSMFRANKNYVDTKVTRLLTTRFALTNVGAPHDVLFKGSVQVLDQEAGAILDGDYSDINGQSHHVHVTFEGLPDPVLPGQAGELISRRTGRRGHHVDSTASTKHR